MSYIDWKIKNYNSSIVRNFASSVGCSDIVARMLLNRGFTDSFYAKMFLEPDLLSVHDPFELDDMQKAVDRIVSAINNHEKICIYGDYDVDGITSVSVLYLYLSHFVNDVEYYIPDRFSQGYGVNENALKRIADNGATLMITVDTGISAFDEIEAASSYGIDVVITDHHECQDVLPEAIAVVNPKRHNSRYPFSKLAGVGVVYKLISALDSVMGTTYADNYLDLVAIGTIADIMPLLDENRYIVSKGLLKIQSSPNVGLKCLMDMCLTSPSVNAGSIGFAIAPRINASGRMSNAEIAVKLFVTSDCCEANSIAEHLCKLNTERQQIENTIYNEAISIIEKHDLDAKYNALVLWNENWHSGVIGIVASRLKDKYNKPVVLFSVTDVAKGSGRSLAPFNLYKAFADCEDILIQFGGHKYAAGVLIENDKLYEFRDRLSQKVTGVLEREDAEFERSIDIECELDHKSVSIETVQEVSKLQPFGKSNEVPLFCIRNVKISSIIPTANNKHLRIKFNLSGKSFTGFYFGVSLQNFDYREGDIVDLVCELSINEYRNFTSVQFTVRDMRYAENLLDLYANKRRFCDECDTVLPLMLPNRNDIGFVYRFISINYSKGRRAFNIDTIPCMMSKDILVKISYEKMYFALQILLELGVISGEISDNDLVLYGLAEGERFSLTDSKLLNDIYQKAGVKFGN